MQWDSSPNAGFSPAGVQTWLPVAETYSTVNVVAESADPHSMLRLTQRLLLLRRGHAALHGGSYTTVNDVPEDCYAYERRADGQRFLIVLNCAAQPQDLALAALGTGQVLLSTQMDREGTIDLSTFTLRPYEGIVVQLS